jgi:V8-like Glu-specific endopeptidase
MKSKVQLHLTILLFLAVLILSVSLAIAPENISRVLAQDSSDTGDVYAISSRGDILDFKSMALESAKTYLTEEYNSKMMPSRPPGEVEAFETLLPDDIIGEDTRYQVYDTTYYPWSTIAKIHGNFGTNIFDCTGWMLGPSTVVTAAHCIYNYFPYQTYASNVTVTPALDSDAAISEPFGVCKVHTAWIVNLWRTTGNSQYDYGVYYLRCRTGEETGILGYRVMSDAELFGQSVNVAGYPLKVGDPLVTGGTTMWFGLGNIVDTPLYFLFYDNDTSEGQSGSPVREDINDACLTCAVAIHTGGNDLGEDYNIGVRITDQVFDFLYVMQQYIYQPIYMPIVLRNETTQGNMAIGNPYPPPIRIPGSTSHNPYPAPSP